ncbi:nucleotidyltransferase family protein [Bacillus niameyensis]|uniref:nucleotidyltransferase family protein n=1 Tax=Bacillus niameyensis TaxID=1522308 RepID=UPI000783A58D|nr:nucleotidyltransferase family protein [Bacillus niameyensis]
MKTAGIYLAAGNSSRMGKNKLALPFQSTTLGEKGLRAALKSKLEKVFVVTRAGVDPYWISSSLKTHSKCSIVPCHSAHLGQAESLKCGIRSAQVENIDSVMVLLADQPFITDTVIGKLINTMEENPHYLFVASICHDQVTPPVLFSSPMFPALLTLKGDKGAKALLNKEYANTGKFLAFPNKQTFLDIDKEADYQRVLRNVP